MAPKSNCSLYAGFAGSTTDSSKGVDVHVGRATSSMESSVEWELECSELDSIPIGKTPLSTNVGIYPLMMVILLCLRATIGKVAIN